MTKSKSTLLIATICLIVGLRVPLATALTEREVPPQAGVARTLTLEAVELVGATRTTAGTVRRHLGLAPGDTVSQDGLWVAVERLRRSDLFRSVEHYTRAGSERGRLVLVLEVVERGPELRLGTGNSDMDGWYVIPAELNLDNLGGRGERAGLRTRFGYRLFDVGLHYGRGFAPDDRTSWTADATVGALDHVYFRDGLEYSIPVLRAGLGLAFEHDLGGDWSLGAGARFESVDVDSTATVRRDDEYLDAATGDEVPFGELPGRVAAGVGARGAVTWRLDLVHDAVSPDRWADSPVSGCWGRLRLTRVGQRRGDHGGVELDLRAYRPLGSGVLAVRGRLAAVGDAAPFYDRLYLGGLYTVRGFPSQSLSPAGGDTRVWHGSAEFRAPLYGDPARPRVAGLLFVDAGGAGDGATAAAAGWGFRLRLGWLGWLGTDVGFPLTDSPVDEGFHAHVSLGWSF